MPRTGPKTPEGKARSSRNAIKHGLTAEHRFVLDNENQEEWSAFLKVWCDKLQPADEAERMIVEDIALAQWKLRRVRTWEAGLVRDGSAAAFKDLADNSRVLDHLHRYETRARRAFKQGLDTLHLLRASRPAPARPPAKADPIPVPPPPPERDPLEFPPPLAASASFPDMPPVLQAEWDYLNATIARFDLERHFCRMSIDLQSWFCEKKAA